ncbi:MAG: bifunctional [glutamate--ammonia ligase]-adenylyl-L-tyrosine phosphorylase/[glutamate--ammonia-ligase] adenylyltransferase, partial [Minicystis sp.]
MSRRSRLLALAQGIDPERAGIYGARFASALPWGTNAHGLATLLAAAYPALAPVLEATPDIVKRLAAEGYLTERDRPVLRARLGARVGDLSEPERVKRELRRASRDERVRIALR